MFGHGAKMMSRDQADSEWGVGEAQCAGCDSFVRVSELGLCVDCAAQLERDLIRKRDWDYSANAFGLTPAQREKLREDVVAKYGKNLELIAP
jgi:hypothetical protein